MVAFGFAGARTAAPPTSGSTRRAWSTTPTRFRPRPSTRARTELDKQGVPVKRTDPALTPEQRRAREAEEEQKRAAAKEQEEVARRDRALVSSYTSETEIDLARSRALATIDAQIESARGYVAQLDKRKVELDKRREALGDKPVPHALERELAGNRTRARQAGRS